MPAIEPGDRQGPRPAPADPVPLARSEDVARRRRIYTIQMAIRTVCFLALPFVPGWWKLVALVGAVVLPYVAVLMANDPDLEAIPEDSMPSPVGPAALPAAPTAGEPERPLVIRYDEEGRLEDVPTPDHRDDEEGA